MGLRNAGLKFRQVEESNILENIIYNELRLRWYNVDVGLIVTNEVNESGTKIKKHRMCLTFF